MLRLADLREILRYVPQYRDRVFVIAVDGAVVENANFVDILSNGRVMLGIGSAATFLPARRATRSCRCVRS